MNSIKILHRLVNFLPKSTGIPLSSILSNLIYILHERSNHRLEVHRAISSALNLKIDDPQLDRLVKAHFKHLLQIIYEIIRFDQLKENWNDLVTVNGIEYYQQAQKVGRGVILFSGHVGNWELLISSLPLLGIKQPYGLGWKQPNTPINNFLDQQRTLWGTRIFWAQELNKKAVEELLCSGGTIFILGDHYEQGKTKVNLLGHPIGTPAGPVLFALKYNATIIPIHSFREGLKHHIIFEPPITLKPLPPTGDLTENLQILMALIEGWIIKHPEQWIWLMKRRKWG